MDRNNVQMVIARTDMKSNYNSDGNDHSRAVGVSDITEFETAFRPTRLGNWEIPRKSAKRLSIPKGGTQVICDEDGRFLSNQLRPKTSPWAKYRNTWQLPDPTTRCQTNKLIEIAEKPKKTTKEQKYNEDQIDGDSDPKQITQQITERPYLPDNYIHPELEHPSRQDLLQPIFTENSRQKESIDRNLYMQKQKFDEPTTYLDQIETQRSETIPRVLGDNVEDNFENMKIQTHIPDKPTERSPSPLIPSYCNFQMAKRMAQENLEHQPLPDCIMDRAFRKLQAKGDLQPGLGLEVVPIASGVGVKTYKAGPTHCTKMKIYRPKTCGVVPKPVAGSHMHRPQTSYPGKQKMNSMDLAICWDYRTADPADEPKPPKHIDGSNGSAGPAIFTLVKTPRTPENIDTGRSTGIFTNTLGEEGFFDKDIVKRKTNFSAQRTKSGLKCSCGTSPMSVSSAKTTRSLSATRHDILNNNSKRYKSSPNLSQLVNVSEAAIYTHDKYDDYASHPRRKKEHTCSKYGPKIKDQQIVKKTQRLCETQEPHPYPELVPKEIYKPAFKAGIPKSNSSGTVTSFDSGCSTMSSGTCSTKVLNIPKPRHPYTKKKYNIETLVPPFTCTKGGAGQGGYPEHWRLASVYQHAYKPIEQRKRPLLATIYK